MLAMHVKKQQEIKMHHLRGNAILAGPLSDSNEIVSLTDS